MRKEHAEHNESLCDFLYDNGNYNDWVVTTAFYSALHFVRHKIFPLTKYDAENGNYKTFDDFEQYLSWLSNPKPNKHRELKKLVYEHSELTPIYGRYLRLFDLCRIARYHNYKTLQEKANIARENLKEIKKICMS